MTFLKRIKILIQLPEGLNWVLSVVEPLTVLAITCLIGYAACWLMFGHEGAVQQTRMVQLVKTLNDNWKATLILLLILFYRTIRMFLEQAEEAWGVKRKNPMIGEQQEQPNPSNPPNPQEKP